MDTITSRVNDRVKETALLCDSARARQEKGLCVAHGIKLCLEAAKRTRVAELWTTDDAAKRYSEEIKSIDAARVVLMSDSVCEKLSPHKTPQGILATVFIPESISLLELCGKRRVLALCSVQDPVNVGTMIRTAAGVGYQGILLSEDCADPFSPKALRASMGAAFSLPMLRADITDSLKALERSGHVTAATALRADSQPIVRMKDTEKLTLLIGNEGSGLSSDLIALCGMCVTLPMTDLIESYNAAAAACIAMWETRL